MDVLLSSFGMTATTEVVAVVFLSSVYGLVIGCIPGLSATMATALLVPIIFYLSPIAAVAAIIGYPPLPTDRLEVVGSRDTLILDRDEIHLVSDPANRRKHDLGANYQACFSGLIASFVQGLRTGKPFPTDRLDNLEPLRLMEGAYAAAGRARPA